MDKNRIFPIQCRNRNLNIEFKNNQIYNMKRNKTKLSAPYGIIYRKTCPHSC